MKVAVALASATAFALTACGAIWGFDDASLERPDQDHDFTDAGKTTDAVARDVQIDTSLPATKSSCSSLTSGCGPGNVTSCCDSPLVPGGQYSRSYDAVGSGSYTDDEYIATVSDFLLDRFEVTVGRYRAFVEAYPNSKPAAGVGKNPRDTGDLGWDASWTAALPSTKADFVSTIRSASAGKCWTDEPGANEQRSMCGINWYEAFAFCIWDGGRLPTEAEWNYAAAGGSEQRARPWSSPSTSTGIDATYALYNNLFDHPIEVGTHSPKGDGKWGHADLAGNLSEWTRDTTAVPYAISPCNDCADRSEGAEAIVRGGSWFNPDSSLFSSFRSSSKRTDRPYSGGVRCARAP